MEFDFDFSQILEADENGIAILEGVRSLKRGPQPYSAGAKTHPFQKMLNEIVDCLGQASANAQDLPVAVTNSLKFFNGEDRLYMLVDSFKILGMLKIGNKKLFIRDEVGNVKEIEPLCVLDFYVHESCQRSGIGKYLFEYMLDNEKIEPYKMGYDRPSEKLMQFLKKHYGLEHYVQQVNNFVVFNSYFLMDKTFRTYMKDPIKPREKVQAPKSIENKPEDIYPSAYDQSYQEKEPQSFGGQMPSYKDAKKLREEADYQQPDYNNYPDAYPPAQEEQWNNNYKGQANEMADTAQRRVHFSEEQPEIYEHQNYDDQGYDPSTQPYDYNNYDGYVPPAGRTYMNPNIEKDQYERRFNRTSGSKMATKETVEELFPHPEADGPLDHERQREKIPVEYDIKKTNQRINDTESELKK